MIEFILKCTLVLSITFMAIMFFIGGIKLFFMERRKYKNACKLANGVTNTLKGNGVGYDLKNKKIFVNKTITEKDLGL